MNRASRPGKTSTTLAAAAVLAAVGGGVAYASPADSAPPTLNVPAYASFIVGSTVTNGPFTGSSNMDMRIRWSASDPSGVCSYDVSNDFAGADPEPVVTGSLATSYTAGSTDYSDQEGGGSNKIEGWIVTAHDCAGNATSKEATTFPEMIQENGASYEYGTFPWTYSGTWHTSSCTCWSYGHDRNTTASNAKAKWQHTYRAGEVVALVMQKGPGRGKFNVLVDGVKKATVDSYASSNSFRNVIWQTRMTGGTHTVTVQNLATPGRPRIDLDGVLLN